MATNLSVAPKPQMSVAPKPKTVLTPQQQYQQGLSSRTSSLVNFLKNPGAPGKQTIVQSTTNPNAQLEALRAKNAPVKAAVQAAFKPAVKPTVNPAATEVGKPISPKVAPPVASQMGAVSGAADQGFKAALAPTDPAAIGGASMAPAAPAPTSPVAPPVPSQPDQLKAAREAYLKSLAPSADVASAQEALGGVAQTAATASAKAQQEYADRIKAIEDQATLQPFLTGRETQAQGQLTNQLAAVQSASQAQTLPLQERLANFQAQQQSQQAQAKEALGQATPSTVEVGGSLVDPSTGNVIYKGPTSTTQPTASIQEYQYAVQNGYTGSFTDYQNEDANRKAQAAGGASDANRVLSATEAQSLGVPFGTTAGAAYGLSPTKPLTEAQAKDVTFGTRAGEANTYINNLESSVASMNPLSFAAQVAAEPNAVGNTFVSDNIRQLRQAERNFETAVLRRESGAAISSSEFATDEKKYFPRPGDDATTLAQKAQARQTAIKSMMPANAPADSSADSGDFSW